MKSKNNSILSSALTKRRVTLEFVETVYQDIDGFITKGEVERSWQVFELTQSQDVREWIDDPDKIEGIQPNLFHLSKMLRKLPPPVKIIDVGCYGGYLYDYLRTNVFKNIADFSYTGVDIQGPAIEAAKEMHKGFDNAQFLVGDIFDLKQKFGKCSFNVAVCSRVLIHLPHFEKAIDNLYHTASDFTFVVLKTDNGPSCIKVKETDTDTGKEVFYFIRSFSDKMVKNVAKELGAYGIVIEDKCYYASVVLSKSIKHAANSYVLKGLKKSLMSLLKIER